MRGAKKKHVKKGHGLVDFESDTLDQCSAIGLMRKISEKAMGGVGDAGGRHLTAGAGLSTLKVICHCCEHFSAIATALSFSFIIYQHLHATDCDGVWLYHVDAWTSLCVIG